MRVDAARVAALVLSSYSPCHEDENIPREKRVCTFEENERKKERYREKRGRELGGSSREEGGEKEREREISDQFVHEVPTYFRFRLARLTFLFSFASRTFQLVSRTVDSCPLINTDIYLLVVLSERRNLQHAVSRSLASCPTIFSFFFLKFLLPRLVSWQKNSAPRKGLAQLLYYLASLSSLELNARKFEHS